MLALQDFDALTGMTFGPVTYLPWRLPVAAIVGVIVGELRAPATPSSNGASNHPRR